MREIKVESKEIRELVNETTQLQKIITKHGDKVKELNKEILETEENGRKIIMDLNILIDKLRPLVQEYVNGKLEEFDVVQTVKPGEGKNEVIIVIENEVELFKELKKKKLAEESNTKE